MKNKQVKQMMCDVFNGEWVEIFSYQKYANVNLLCISCIDGDDCRYRTTLDETVSIRACDYGN